MTATQQTHWNHVARQWQHWGPPLRPCPSDLRLMEELVRTWTAADTLSSSRALLWGVTPEIALMDWPNGMQLLAVDHSQDMIDGIWPGNLDGHRMAIQGNWLDLPPGSAEFDVVIGDGVFTLLSFPDDYRSMAARAGRLLRNNGVLISRVFIRPVEAESIEVIVEDLHSGRIGNFHILKFRIAISLQKDATSGVRMGDVYDAWVSTFHSATTLADSTGWSIDTINTIEQYRNRDSRLTFPTLDEFHEAMDTFLEPIACRFPDYEMGDRCPILCYRPRSAAAGHGHLR